MVGTVCDCKHRVLFADTVYSLQALCIGIDTAYAVQTLCIVCHSHCTQFADTAYRL